MKIKCTNCGALAPIDEYAAFVQCPYCRAALVVQIETALVHRLVTPTRTPPDLAPALRRQLRDIEAAGNPEIHRATLVYYPFWRFAQTATPPTLVAAAAEVPGCIAHIRQPSGNAPFYPDTLPVPGTVCAPDIPVEEAHASAQRLGIGNTNAVPNAAPKANADAADADTDTDADTNTDTGASEHERAAATLLHVPFFHIQYSLNDETQHGAWVDACAAEVFADRWPPSTRQKNSTRFIAAALLTFGAFTLQAWHLPFSWLLLTYPLSGIALYYFFRRIMRTQQRHT